MEKSSENSATQETPLTVGLGKVVTIKLGDNEKTFFVANEEQILPNGISKDMLPNDVMITELDAPIVKHLLGKTADDVIEPENEAEIPRGQGYRRLGVKVIGVASLEEFLASHDDNDQRDANDEANE